MKNILRKIIFGEEIIREYITVRIEDKIRERVYLQNEAGNHTQDVSENHWVLCLEPLVFGIWIGKEETISLVQKAGWELYFREGVTGPFNKTSKILAAVKLDFIDQIEEEFGTLFLFRIKTCRIFHIHFLKARLLYLKYYKKPGFSFDKLKSFAAAYSYPRKVRIISYKDENYYNIFPMDLLGDISRSGRYVFGLRHTNHALSRIMEAKKIVVSEISYEQKNIIYQLGSHHSTKPPPAEQLPFAVMPSKNFRFWIPEWAESCKEIRVIKTINLGSHMLMWGEPIAEYPIKPPAPHLHHIHFLLYMQQKTTGFCYPLA
jgi:hypothetical protein